MVDRVTRVRKQSGDVFDGVLVGVATVLCRAREGRSVCYGGCVNY